ncbi:substrate-binding periplasmic protein [Roseateles amylovorans]|uniref:Transporter substrate-binding domain-containing protein n=1 Tax=Roseateles amylovorans TaxID=2978473 RepID=A0ABY6B937_9BURK|nr:transporter substrate-binding domain-containing protein [Roseateles amylovorans]UXH80421.1 transporter substrate-binding domain-containing protein [Roseateles amylovorans]
MGPVRAQCSRTIRVPLSPTGLSVVASGGAVAGVYPDILRKVSEETHCQFEFTVVPRARLEAMFSGGSADLLLAATRSSGRDARGDFVPTMRYRPMLISLVSDRASIDSLAELSQRRELRVVLVRGYDYGEAYQALIQTLREQKRLLLEADPLAVARALERNLADVTLMVPSILTGTLLQDGRQRALMERLRYEPVAELGWGESGVYLSRHLSAQDRELLSEAIERSTRSGAFWKTVQRHYPPGSYEDGLKPLK